MDFENLNQKLGGCGIYQYIVFILLSVTTFKYAMDMEALTFSVYSPKFQCVTPSNSSSSENGTSSYVVSESQCQYKASLNDTWIPCSQWSYERNVLSTSLVSEFNLVCKKAYLKDFMFSAYFSGSLFTFPLAMFTDKIGRNVLLITFTYLSVVVTVVQALINTLWQHYVIFFLVGAAKTIYVGLAFTTVIELMPIKHLDLAATNFWLWYAVGYMGSALVAFYGRSWRSISAFSLILSVCYIGYPCFAPETPRWLMLNEKKKKCYKVVTFIARVNGKHILKSDFDKWNPIKEKTGNMITFFKHKTMIFRLVIMNLTSYSFNFAYLGSATDLTFASNNIFISTFVMGLIEVPTGPVAGFLANKIGRKKSVHILTIIGILCLTILPFIEPDLSKSAWQPWLKLVLAMISKLGFTSAWLVFDVISNELIPTTHRNGALSIVYISAGIGSIVAPPLHKMALTWHYSAPCLIYSVMLSVSIILLGVFIPETYGLPVPQTMEQATRLVIHKEKEWKEYMIEQTNSLGMETVMSKQ